jgi:hypothetical protein
VIKSKNSSSPRILSSLKSPTRTSYRSSSPLNFTDFLASPALTSCASTLTNLAPRSLHALIRPTLSNGHETRRREREKTKCRWKDQAKRCERGNPFQRANSPHTYCTQASITAAGEEEAAPTFPRPNPGRAPNRPMDTSWCRTTRRARHPLYTCSPLSARTRLKVINHFGMLVAQAQNEISGEPHQLEDPKMAAKGIERLGLVFGRTGFLNLGPQRR